MQSIITGILVMLNSYTGMLVHITNKIVKIVHLIQINWFEYLKLKFVTYPLNCPDKIFS